MTGMRNRQIRLARLPSGIPTSSDFKPFEADVAPPTEGEFLARTLYLSLDPGLRSRMMPGSYAGQVQPDQVVPGYSLSEVVASRNEDFEEGDLVVGPLGWQEYAISNGSNVIKEQPPADHPITSLLHVLGSVGLTAWIGLEEIGKPRTGETIVVSAAAGAVGSTAGQIAKIKGCRVVGIASTSEKCAYAVSEFGFDACIDRKSPDFSERLREACQSGIDVYFDNVGGDVLSAVLEHINLRSRIVLCGLVAEYGDNHSGHNLRPILMKRATMKGFINFDHLDRLPAARADIGSWLTSGQLKYVEDVTEGIENTANAFIRMLTGETRGKAMVCVAKR